MKEVVLINDIAAIAACTLGVSVPILSVCDCKPYPVPTAVFTSSTRIEGFACTSLSAFLPAYAKHWSTLQFRADAVMTGCFADADGVDAAIVMLDTTKGPSTLCVVDPVMGDDGHLFASDAHVQAMRRLLKYADVMCPNFTEFCALLGEDYAAWDQATLDEKVRLIKERAADTGVAKVVVTGLRESDVVANVVFDGTDCTVYRHPFCNKGVCGTGDMFSSILLVGLLFGKDINETVSFAGQWIRELAAVPPVHPERGLFIGGERLFAIRRWALS